MRPADLGEASLLPGDGDAWGACRGRSYCWMIRGSPIRSDVGSTRSWAACQSVDSFWRLMFQKYRYQLSHDSCTPSCTTRRLGCGSPGCRPANRRRTPLISRSRPLWFRSHRRAELPLCCARQPLQPRTMPAIVGQRRRRHQRSIVGPPEPTLRRLRMRAVRSNQARQPRHRLRSNVQYTWTDTRRSTALCGRVSMSP